MKTSWTIILHACPYQMTENKQANDQESVLVYSSAKAPMSHSIRQHVELKPHFYLFNFPPIFLTHFSLHTTIMELTPRV